MDKAEELRRLIINDLYLNMDEDMATDTLERIDEYAQKVSKEKVIDFYISHVNNPPDKKYVLRKYNKWKSKQKKK